MNHFKMFFFLQLLFIFFFFFLKKYLVGHIKPYSGPSCASRPHFEQHCSIINDCPVIIYFKYLHFLQL